MTNGGPPQLCLCGSQDTYLWFDINQRFNSKILYDNKKKYCDNIIKGFNFKVFYNYKKIIDISPNSLMVIKTKR